MSTRSLTYAEMGEAALRSETIAEAIGAPEREKHRDAPLGGGAFMAGAVMPASPSRAAPVRANDLAFLRLLEASLETLSAENEFLKRRLVAADARAAQAAISERFALAAERARPWWRRLTG
jgi:hypothetical protein